MKSCNVPLMTFAALKRAVWVNFTTTALHWITYHRITKK